MMLTFVIGLSIEEPAFNRTTTRKALVAAKAWVSHYPKLEIICNQVSLSIQGAQVCFVRFTHSLNKTPLKRRPLA